MKKYILFLLLGIFLFIFSIEGVKSGWGIMGGSYQEQILGMLNSGTVAVAGLAIGLLATSLVQSSSAVVAGTMASLAGMVASGVPLPSAISFGIPVVLGANIGTTVTNSVVAIGHYRDGKEFYNVVPGAIVHDIFNIINVSFFFLLELTTGLLSYLAVSLSGVVTGIFGLEAGSMASLDFLNFLIEKPLVSPISNFLSSNLGVLFGGISLVGISFGTLILALALISKNIKHLINTTSLQEKIFRALKSPFRSVATGTSVTWSLQSSSIATSLALPFLATEAIDLEQMYAYTLGCNIGTTIDMSQIYGYAASGMAGITLGLTHIMINAFGVAIWLFTPLKRVPPYLAQRIGNSITARRIAPAFLMGYVGLIFFALPLGIIFFF